MAGIEQAFENFVKRVSSQEEPQSEYGEPQTGDKRIPIYQNINPGYDVYESMPTRGGNYFQQDLAYGGRAGYGLGGAISKAVDSLGTQISEKLPQEQQQALTQITIDGGGGLGNLLSRIISKVKDMVKPIATGMATPMATPTTSIPTTEIIPPADNKLTRPLGMAGFGGSEIVDILKRLGYTFADGGRVSMSEGGLTKTVPPAKGPDSQGVESLFRRRYI
jgi:hypothetical protein